jgi:large subunit ribosomal protein L25
MKTITLKARSRKETGKGVRSFRSQGLIPAVSYGHKIEAQSLWVDSLAFKKIFAEAGENTVIELDIEGGKKLNVLVHEVQTEPMSGSFSHIDFFQVRMDEKIETQIPLEFVGESPAVKALGGVLIKSMDEVEVSCLPMDLPSKIEVNLDDIKTFDDHLKVKDLKVSEKVKILSDGDTVVALVEPPRTDEELAKLNEKVEMDVTKVEGVVKEAPATEEPKKE